MIPYLIKSTKWGQGTQWVTGKAVLLSTDHFLHPPVHGALLLLSAFPLPLRAPFALHTHVIDIMDSLTSPCTPSHLLQQKKRTCDYPDWHTDQFNPASASHWSFPDVNLSQLSCTSSSFHPSLGSPVSSVLICPEGRVHQDQTAENPTAMCSIKRQVMQNVADMLGFLMKGHRKFQYMP